MRIDGRVTSIQIEDDFWRLLKHQAATEGETLSVLLTRLRRQVPASENFTSTLRLHCFRSVTATLARREAALTELAAAGAREDAVALLAMLPMPALLLDARRTIAARSIAFLDWIGVPAEAVDGRRFEVLVARSARDALDELWGRCQREPRGRPVDGIVNLVVAGRVRIARLSLRRTSAGGAFVLF